MRAVADTNIVVSGLLWHGPPRQVLERARTGSIELFTTAALLAELQDVLDREKISRRLRLAGLSSHELVIGYAALAEVIAPAVIEPAVASDPDDDTVLACAIAAAAGCVVTGDAHLLRLKYYRGIQIFTAADFLALSP
jgi:uncharacterized protein